MAGLLALLLAMGIGRFAFTALLPQMRDEGLLDVASGGLLAAANYLGYLAGALWAAFSRRADAARRLLAGLLVSVGTTLAMGLELGFPLWCGVRFLSGVASAAVYVYATGIVLRSLAACQAAGWSGLHYMGVGSGIVVSALLARYMTVAGSALEGWRWLGVVAALGAMAVMVVLLPLGRSASPADEQSVPAGSGGPPMGWLAAAYGLAGFGYIVNATFLPLMLRGQAGTASAALDGWLVVGLAALPATLFWVRLSFRWGVYPALISATLIQAMGVALPVLMDGVAAAMAGAALLGATFMGIAGLSQWLARVPDPRVTARRIGLITACYGVGQVFGPLLVALRGPAGGFAVPVLAASAALLCSAVLLELSRRRERLA
ncbi:MAG: YbfB/YjiJ family MFS transporter [Zoogloea sp.]|nr:YbfB/YjiJ family MFS transporter [Zoogloea sp.]